MKKLTIEPTPAGQQRAAKVPAIEPEKSAENETSAGQQQRAEKVPAVEAIQAKGEYRIRLTSLAIAFILVTGGIIFLMHPASLAAIWSVITPIILTILGMALRNNGKPKTVRK